MADWRDWEFDEIPEWSNKAQHVLLLLVFVLGLFGIYYFYYLPSQEEMLQTREKTQSLKKTFEQKAKNVAQFADLDTQINELKEFGQNVENQFSSKDDITQSIQKITILSEKYSLKLLRIDRQETKTDDRLSYLPISLKFRGSYTAFGRFSAQLAKLPFFVILKDLKISSTNNNLSLFKSKETKHSDHNADLDFLVTAKIYLTKDMED